MGWKGQVARMGMMNAYILVRKPKAKYTVENLDIDGKIILK
jgi:hypothetical protein